jgi:Concanavalin A-like lectin/glucanases superfamily
VRADAPAAYWRLGELSGTAMLEDQARANGTYSGGVVLGVDPAINDANRAARFDGGNDKGSVPDNSSLDFGTDDFTVEAWVKTTFSGERAVVAKRSLATSEPYWAVTVTDDSHHDGQIRAAYFDGTNVRQAYSTVGVLDGAWHHVAVWFDRDAGVTISIDGVSASTALAIAPDVSNTGTIEIGKGPTHNYFKGDLDEVALYRGLVPAERIAAHRAAAA